MRELFLGNRSLHVNFDHGGSARDLFFRWKNHLNNHKIRLGVYVDDRFAWLDEAGFERVLGFREDARQTDSTFVSHDLALTIRIRETVLDDKTCWLRQIELTNGAEWPRRIRLFQTHDIRVNESEIADCALYHPDIGGMAHYKDRVWLGFGFRHYGPQGESSADQYSVGEKAWAGKEGTWRDAEDGVLEMKPIEQGSIDSTMRIVAEVGSQATETVWAVMFGGLSEEGLVRSFAEVTQEWLQGAMARPSEAPVLDAVSERIIETHQMAGGGFAASTDSEIMEIARSSYAMVWMRDAGLTAELCLRMGRDRAAADALDHARRCPKVIPGAWGQKYTLEANFACGWHPRLLHGERVAPIQEDETALIAGLAARMKRLGLYLSWMKFCEEVLIWEPARFLLSYRDDFGLPLPSWDLWEERRGIHLWTAATVIDALEEIGRLGDGEVEMECREAADKMKSAAIKAFVDPHSGFISRTLQPLPGGGYEGDATTDASILAALLRPCFADRTDLLLNAVNQVMGRLLVHSAVGGIARYEGDYYFRRHEGFAGNPWVICTLWLARALLKLGKFEEASRWLEWAEARKSGTGVLAEQYDPVTGQALSVCPLVWSHAEYLETRLDFEEFGAKG